MKDAKRSKEVLGIIRQLTARKIAVLPLSPKGKAPAIYGGVHKATTDEKTINRYFDTHPDANYGVAIGTWFFVLDIDGDAGKLM